MRRQSYRRAAWPLILVLALVIGACAGESETTTTSGATDTSAGSGATTTAAPGSTTTVPPDGAMDTMVVATGDEFECFDPALCSSALPNTTVNHHIFSSLVQHIGDPMVLVPNLASSWEYSDPETLTFELNPDAVFSNGEPVTADDVVYSFEQYAKEESPRVSYVSAITSVTADGPNTVTFTTDGPRTDLMGNLARLFILPAGAREEAGSEEFGQHPVGSGPYLLESNDGGTVVLVRNDDWWGGMVEPARIELRTTTDPATRAALLQSGEAQVIDGVPLESMQSLEDGGFDVISLKGARTIMYVFNTTEAPFDDVRVRQAVNYAVDQKSLIENVLQGRGAELHGPWAPAWLGYDPDMEDTYQYDPDRARELLADAGYADGFETTFYITDGNRMKDGELGQAIQAMLADVGINVELIPTPSTTTNDEWKAGDFSGITSVTWSLPGDPGGMVTYSFGNKNALAPDAQLDELVSATQTEVDEAARTQALFDLGQYVNDQALWLFTHAQDALYAKAAGVAWEPVPISSGGATLWYWTP